MRTRGGIGSWLPTSPARKEIRKTAIERRRIGTPLQPMLHHENPPVVIIRADATPHSDDGRQGGLQIKDCPHWRSALGDSFMLPTSLERGLPLLIIVEGENERSLRWQTSNFNSRIMRQEG